MPDGRRIAILASRAALYRAGRMDEQHLLDESIRGATERGR